MKKLTLIFLLVPLVSFANTAEIEKFVILAEGHFKAVCTKDRSDCKCFIYQRGWVEFECPKPKKEQAEGKK